MAEYKLVISDPKSGKSLQKEVKDNDAKHFQGLKLGETVKGELIDLPGYEFLITGGSDAAGFPMRRDASGAGRIKILAAGGVGVSNKKRKPNPKKKGWRTMKGMRRKKTVAGNTIHEKTAQINLKVTKAGSQPLFEDTKPEAEAAPVADAPKEEAKEEVKPEPTPEPKKDEVLEEIEKKVEEDEKEIEKLDEEEKKVEEELKKVDSEEKKE